MDKTQNQIGKINYGYLKGLDETIKWYLKNEEYKYFRTNNFLLSLEKNLQKV